MTTSSIRRSDEFRIAVTGDDHLGHPNCTTPEIVKNLFAAFPDNAETARLNMIVINGDFFDRLLPLAFQYVFEIRELVHHFLRVCKKHDIIIRVVEGTPRHDNKQSAMFEHENTLAEIGADLKYVTQLSIEYIERYGISVLYVPDEVNHESHKTLSQVHELLRAKGLTHVDYAFMHGMFQHQVPEISNDHKHDNAAYLAIVKHLIFVSHVHTYSQYDRIIAPGSFDRLKHNEEEPKGHVRSVVKSNGEWKVKFIENKGAKRFDTLDCTGLEMEALLVLVDERAKTLPELSHLRIKAEKRHPIFTNMETLITRWPMLNWDKKQIEDEEKEKVLEIDEEEIYRPIALTEANLAELLMSRVASMNPSAQVLAAARELMEEVM